MNQWIYFIESEHGHGALPVFEASSQKDIMKFVDEHRPDIDTLILKHGGILLRNFDIYAVSEFSRLSSKLMNEQLDYIHRSTPRTLLGKKIYTASEYPSDKEIALHNENAYTKRWPDKIIFFCVIAPKSQGETPVANSHEILKNISSDLVKKFNDYQVSYIRNYIPGMDLSWQEVFQTEQKAVVDEYCLMNDIDVEWSTRPDSPVVLTTRQTCQATLEHPITHQFVWFNQAHLFHESALTSFERETILKKYAALPRNVTYGNGQSILEEELSHIREVINREKIVFSWKKGDVLILDNRLMCHGRHPFSGERKIVVTMGA